MSRLWIIAGVAVAALLTGSASAELYRCEGPDGEPVFTDQKGVCPGAEGFEPDGVVLQAPSPTAPPAAILRRNRILSDHAAESGAEEWQQKKREAEARVQQIQVQRDRMKPYVGHCNRGGYVATRDDAGIEQMVNCSQLRERFAELDAEEAKAKAYLDDGLPEECRKAGCEPGWIR